MMIKIEQNWEAIKEVEKLAQNRFDDPEAGFNSDLFFLNEKRLMIPLKYRKKTKGGYTKRYYQCLIAAKFCPFTGVPLYKESADGE